MIRKLGKLIFKYINFADNYGREYITGTIRSHPSPKIILDLGAGQGYDILMAKKLHPKAKCVAVENYPAYVKNLTSKSIKVIKLNLERDKLPFKNESIDIIIANQIIEHCKDTYFVLDEISRVLKIGGIFIMGVPNLAALHNRIILLFGQQPPCIYLNEAHVRGITFPGLKELMKQGSQNQLVLLSRSGGVSFYPFPAPLSRFLAKLFPSLAWGIFTTWQKKEKYTHGFISLGKKSVESNFYFG